MPTGRFATPADLGSALREASLEAGSARGTVDASSADGSVRGDLSYTFAEGDVRVGGRVSLTGPISIDVGLVIVDDTAYVEVPTLFRFVTGTPWVRLPMPSGAEAGETDIGLGEAVSAQVPGEALLDPELVPDPDGEGFTYLGSQVVEDTPVERYEVRADVDGVSTTTVYWVGEDDLLRRLDARAEDPATLEPATSTTTYGDWGDPVTINAPDPGEVSDLPAGIL